VRCSKCGAENPSNKKFCGDCGAPLANLCPKCRADNPAGKRFCGECGAALGTAATVASASKSADSPIRVTGAPAPETLEGERKTVTALFADIKGSTELMEHLDPEDARRVIDPALRLMIDAVHRYDGYVVQSTGDGIFALFGAPIANEDHPQRALYAALRMQDELKRHSDRVRAEGGLPVQARVGINTGEVVVRSIKTGEGHVEYTPVGHTTNLASRMQTLAPIGSIATTDATRRLCEGYFTFKALGPTKVKGVAEPVAVNEVTGLGPLRTKLQRSAGRGLTKFVGRDREMDAMRAAAQLAREGRGQIVAAIAEAGTGKSRLFFEFKAKNQSGWMVLETFSVSHGKASAYFPVIDLLHGYFGIEAGDDSRKRREKVNGRVVALDRNLEGTLPYLFGLLGLVEGNDPLAQMDGQVRKRRTLEAFKRILLRESLNQPLMVIFEDLHWIDEHTQEFLNLLADSIGTAKILLLVNYRPEYSHGWGSKTYYTQLRLDPLGRETASELLTALLGGGSELAPLKSVIIVKTEGNPFFMEETVQVLLDDGALIRNGTMKLTRPLAELKISPTVQGILAARIDRLPQDSKELLQTLSVIGREFPLSLVRAVVTKSDDELTRILNDLQLGEFIYEQAALGETEFVFKHALTQEVAYNSVLVERRKQLHERIGAALESLYPSSLDDHLAELAHHYSRSDNIEKAIEYLGRAGQQAVQRSAYADAISNFGLALNLLQRLPNGPERIRRELSLRLVLGTALSAVQGYAAPEVAGAYIRARELCERLGDPPELFPTLYGLFVVHALRAELRKSYDLGEQLLVRAQAKGDPELLLYAHRALGSTSYQMGRLPQAKEHLEMALSFYDPERRRPLAFRSGVDTGITCLSHAIWTLWQLGYSEQALQRANEAIALGQRLSDPRSLVHAGLFVGVLRQYRREVSAARENAEMMIAISAEHGLTDYSAFATSLCGWAMAEQGRRQEGIAQIQEGLAMSRATGAEILRPYFLSLLAEAYIETGRLDDGMSALTGALEAADEHENRHYEAETYRLKGELVLRRHNSNAAESQRCFQRAIEIARSQSAKSWELRATMSLARLIAWHGRRDEARAMLAEIYNWFTEGFDTADLKDAKALLDELSH